MGVVAWFVRCVPGLSILALVSLVICALGDPEKWLGLSDRHRGWRGSSHRHGQAYGHARHQAAASDTLSSIQLAFVFYTVLIHFLALGFPLRLCYAVHTLTKELKAVIAQKYGGPRDSQIRSPTRTVGSPGASLSHIETARRDPPATAPAYGAESRLRSDSVGMVVHAILLPNYKEDLDTLRETLDVLASHAQARTSYDVSLAPPWPHCSLDPFSQIN